MLCGIQVPIFDNQTIIVFFPNLSDVGTMVTILMLHSQYNDSILLV